MAGSHDHRTSSEVASGDRERARAVKRVTWIALFSNLLISAAKMAAGLLGNSQAVVADAVHSASDSMTLMQSPPSETG